MFIELHFHNGEAILFNTENIDIIVSKAKVEGCKAAVGLSSSDDAVISVKETYDEIKALLAGQVVTAQKGTGKDPDEQLKKCVEMLAEFGRTL